MLRTKMPKTYNLSFGHRLNRLVYYRVCDLLLWTLIVILFLSGSSLVYKLLTLNTVEVATYCKSR